MQLRQTFSASNLVIGTVSLVVLLKLLLKLRSWSDNVSVSRPQLLTTASFPLELLPSTRLLPTTPFLFLKSVPAVSFSLYIPPQHYNPDPEGIGSFRPANPPEGSPYLKPQLPLIVTIHGTTRDAASARDDLIRLANASRAAVLAPLFPAGIDGPNDFDSYKTLRPAARSMPGVFYDQALRDILYIVARRWPGIDTSRIFLVGFSGGGSFALRFAIAWPHLLAAVSIGAPTGSSVLGPERGQKWPLGLENVKTIFGDQAFHLDAVRDVPWQLVIGAWDDALEGSLEAIAQAVTNETQKAKSEHRKAAWDKVIHQLRPDRERTLQQLAQGLREYSVDCKVQLIPSARHSRADVQPAVDAFLETQLERYWRQHQVNPSY